MYNQKHLLYPILVCCTKEQRKTTTTTKTTTSQQAVKLEWASIVFFQWRLVFVAFEKTKQKKEWKKRD